MENLVLIVHLLTAIAIVVLILMQRGKGAEMGASFGAGASQTLFGAAGSGNFFSKATGWLAALFFATSMSLAVIAKQSTTIDGDIPLPAIEEVDAEIPTLDDSEIPVLDAAPAQDDIPSIPVE